MTATQKLFTPADRQEVTRAVADAELRTGAEIVPVVARASGRYDRPEDIVGLWTALLALVVAWFLLPSDQLETNSWGGFAPAWQLIGLLTAVVVGFIVGAIAGSRLGWLRRLFTPQQQMADEVMARAKQVFFDRSVRRTVAGSGVLIFVSLFERRAAILADQLVVDKLGQAALDELCRQLTVKLGTMSTTKALCEVIAAAGEQLSSAVPRSAADVNELSDALVVLD
jgi:putative membrane protein